MRWPRAETIISTEIKLRNRDVQVRGLARCVREYGRFTIFEFVGGR